MQGLKGKLENGSLESAGLFEQPPVKKRHHPQPISDNTNAKSRDMLFLLLCHHNVLQVAAELLRPRSQIRPAAFMIQIHVHMYCYVGGSFLDVLYI